MSIRRNDHRRRRVILDEVAQSVSVDNKTGGSKSVGESTIETQSEKAYSAGAIQCSQFKTTDLIPKGGFSISLVVSSIVVFVVLLNVLAHYSAQWSGVLGADGIALFQLSGAGTLSSWFSSFLMVLASLVSIQIYALRRHRCNDYRGTYRIWLWFAGVFLLGSICCIVDVGIVIGGVGAYLSDQVGATGIWVGVLIAAKFVALTVLAIRGAFEVRASKVAMVVAVFVWLAYASAIAFQIPVVQEQMVLEYKPCFGNCVLFGTGSMLIGVLTYARFVFLHANGLIEIPQTATVDQAATQVSKKQKQAALEPKNTSVKKTSSKPASRKAVSQESKTSAGKTKPARTAKTVVSESGPKLAQNTSDSKPEATRGKTVVGPASKKPGKSPLSSRLKSRASGTSTDSVNKVQPESAQTVDMSPELNAEIISLTEKVNLSKAEKRRLKKLQKRQNRAA